MKRNYALAAVLVVSLSLIFAGCGSTKNLAPAKNATQSDHNMDHSNMDHSNMQQNANK